MQITSQLQEHDVVVLEAPTGIGKSLVGYLTTQDYKKSLYITHSIGLQSQIVRDYPDVRLIKGRSNYSTLLYPDRFNEYQNLSCGDCNARKVGAGDDSRWECDWCGDKRGCPYEREKNLALYAQVAVVNSAYALTEWNGPGRFSNRDLVVWDECDTAEKDLMGHVEVVVPKYLQLGQPRFITKPEAWAEWVEQAIPELRSYIAKRVGNKDVKVQRQVKRLKELADNMTGFKRGLETGETEWILQAEQDKLSFRPVKVDSLGQKMIWRHGRKWLLMSATVISPEVLLENLGYSDSFGFVKLPSTFKVENRKIIPKPTVNMSKKNLEENPDDLTRLLTAVQSILDNHPKDRILIHSVSYKLTESIVRSISDNCRNVYSYTQSRDKQAALDKYLDTPGAVLVGPSLDRGVDLPDDACRCQILVKVPYPNLGDKQIKKRVWTKGGRVWYCVDPATPILTSDLLWVPAGDIKPEQTLVAFDESAAWKQWRVGTVEKVAQLIKPCYQLTLSGGTTVKSSEEHMWLTARGKKGDSGYDWRETQKMRVGTRLVKVLNTWKPDTSYEAGYMAGVLDGEGYLTQQKVDKFAGKVSTSLGLGFAQKKNEVSDRALAYCLEQGFDFGTYANTRDDCFQFELRGGRPEILRCLGTVRPTRLMNKLDLNLLGMMYAIDKPSVISIEYLGDQEVTAIQTDQRTFVANGLASHNCVETIRTLVQMTGRAVRSEEDWAVAYVLDKQFSGLIQQNRGLVPKWWADGIVWNGR